MKKEHGKSTWGPGPWHNETDRIGWPSRTDDIWWIGFDCNHS